MDLVLADCTGMIGIVELPTNLITKEAGFKVGIIKDTLHLSSEAKPAKLSCRFTSRLPRNSQSYLWVRKQIEDICFPNHLPFKKARFGLCIALDFTPGSIIL